AINKSCDASALVAREQAQSHLRSVPDNDAAGSFPRSGCAYRIRRCEAGASSVRKRDIGSPSFRSDKAAKARYLLGVGSLDQAQLLAEQALAEDEDSADTHSLVASILDCRGEWQASLDHLRRAHDLMPDGPQVRLNLAMALLRLGNYHEGLPLYEARLDKTTWSGFATLESRTALRHRLLRPGEPVEGRRILLLAEHGLGD